MCRAKTEMKFLTLCKQFLRGGPFDFWEGGGGAGIRVFWKKNSLTLAERRKIVQHTLEKKIHRRKAPKQKNCNIWKHFLALHFYGEKYLACSQGQKKNSCMD